MFSVVLPPVVRQSKQTMSILSGRAYVVSVAMTREKTHDI